MICVDTIWDRMRSIEQLTITITLSVESLALHRSQPVGVVVFTTENVGLTILMMDIKHESDMSEATQCIYINNIITCNDRVDIKEEERTTKTDKY